MTKKLTINTHRSNLKAIGCKMRTQTLSFGVFADYYKDGVKLPSIFTPDSLLNFKTLLDYLKTDAVKELGLSLNYYRLSR